MSIQDSPYRFPFGRPVQPYQRPNRNPSRVLVLGAYPSALHVRWKPPAPFRPVTAIAVDIEPSPFWDGSDETERVNEWKAKYFRDGWGSVEPAGRFNGSSGAWVVRHVLTPLKVDSQSVWFTDCLDTYRCSQGLDRRLTDTYHKLPPELDLPRANLPKHPSEAQIVAEALEAHRSRLMGELTDAKPDIVITLGNAALSVLRALAENGAQLPMRLKSDTKSYGQRLPLAVAGLGSMTLMPLAHPGAPETYQRVHQAWAMENNA